MLLVAINHPQIAGLDQIGAALAGPFRQPRQTIVRTTGPGQIRPRRPGLLALLPLQAPTPFHLHWRRGSARIVVFGRRRRRILTVPRQQMLQLGQLHRQRLVGSDPLRHLCGHRGDLPIRSSDPHVLCGNPGIPIGELVGLLTNEHDQLVTRQLLRRRHPKISSVPNRKITRDTPYGQATPAQQSHTATPTLRSPHLAPQLNTYGEDVA